MNLKTKRVLENEDRNMGKINEFMAHCYDYFAPSNVQCFEQRSLTKFY